MPTLHKSLNYNSHQLDKKMHIYKVHCDFYLHGGHLLQISTLHFLYTLFIMQTITPTKNH